MGSNPGWSYGYVPTQAEWMEAFTVKQDELGYAPVNRVGDSMLGRLVTFASTPDDAGFNINPGVAPTTPADGDIWFTAVGMFIQVNGSTIGPISGLGSITADDVDYGFFGFATVKDALDALCGDNPFSISRGGSGASTAIAAADNFSPKGANVASAATADLANTTGDLVHITGVVTITGFNALPAGAERTLIFDGILTLTHNAVSLILPFGANIITGVGDRAIIRSEGSGNYICISYQRAAAVTAIDDLSTKGTSIASATTTNIATATGDYVHITGSVTITGFGTAPAGAERTLVFDAAPLVTHNATSLILPGGQNFQAAAGDVIRLRSEGAGNWKAVSFGNAIVGTSGTFFGAFTSLGIDDNATGERMQITDTVINFGTTVTYSLSHAANNADMILAGGDGGNNGANIRLFGQSHATQAYDILLRTNANIVYNWDDSASTHQWYAVASTERMRLDPGALYIGQSSTATPGSGNNTIGIAFSMTGLVYASSAGSSLVANRTADGQVVNINVGGTNTGGIASVGGTVSIVAFFASHWSQLADGSKPAILRGSIVESIDQMCKWLAFSYTDHNGVKHTSEAVPAGMKAGDVFPFTYNVEINEEVKNFDLVEEVVTQDIDESYIDYEVVDGIAQMVDKTRPKRVPIYDEFPLANGKDMVRVARKIRIKHERIDIVKRIEPVTVDATVFLQNEERLPCFKISDKAGSKVVYGIFAWWDDQDGGTTNDAYIGALGAYVIRIAKGVTVQIGDYIESNGDGCGRVQKDDVLHASTVAKITSTTVAETYPDGSYLVPCTLHCG